jgi:hypothetical protein
MVSRVAASGEIRIAQVSDGEETEAGPMLSDGTGGIWLGLRPDGLRRVDRNGVATMPPEAARLQKGSVWSLARDHQGNLWVGQVGTVTRFDSTGARHSPPLDGAPPGPCACCSRPRQHALGRVVRRQVGPVPRWAPAAHHHARRPVRRCPLRHRPGPARPALAHGQPRRVGRAPQPGGFGARWPRKPGGWRDAGQRSGRARGERRLPGRLA